MDDAMKSSVLVVGAGPSGLMVAHELRRYGIACTIIEKDTEKNPYSRAIGVQIRTLEIFHALGLLPALKKKAHDVNSISVFAESAKPITIQINSRVSFFDHLLVVDQPHTEEVLEYALGERDQEILRGVELIDFVVEHDGARANLRMPNGEIKSEHFSYIIGADGAHSIVRKKMSNQFLGSSYEDAFILADVECLHDYDHHTFRVFFKKHGFLALIPMDGPNHYRLISVRRGDLTKMGPMPTLEEFQNIARAVVPFPIEIKNAAWLSRFFVQCRSASHYQEGRIFLVGDAAHIHSPAGGQGMNTGLQDSFNLAWKLALVIKGVAKRNLLETYHVERKPVGDFLIDRTDRFFKFMVRSSLWARLLRKIIVPLGGRREKLRSKVFAVMSQTAIRYDAGARCFAPHQKIGEISIGKRVPNLHLITNDLKKTDLHTLATRGVFSCWVLVAEGMDKRGGRRLLSMVNKLTQRFARGLDVFFVFANDYDAEKIMGDSAYLVASKPQSSFICSEPIYILLRPDHHVFCAGLSDEMPHALEHLASFLVTN